MSALSTLVLLAAPVLPLAALQAPSASAPAVAPATTRAATLLERVVVVGASLSEGFGLDSEVGAHVTLGDVIQSASPAGAAKPAARASLLLFVSPREVGRREIDAARKDEPTLLVALDWLFWFGYGDLGTEERRLAELDFGLAQLEGFACPILLGDLPDMSAALAGKPQMIQKQQIPEPAVLAKLNERVRAWAGKHENVVLFPLAELVTRFRAGQEIRVHGNTIHASELPDLLQSDLLHPTAAGTIVVWIAAADALALARKDVPATAFEWDRFAIWRKLYASQESERRKRLAEKQKQYERDHPPPPPPDPAEQARRKNEGGGRDG